jgi:HlyD family secretion protein
VKKILLFVILAAAGVAGFVYSQRTLPIEPAKVVRAPVSYGPVTETVKAVGYLEPLRRVNVGAQVSGLIKELYADYNSVVKEGQLLAEIDSTEFEVQVAIQEANIDRLKTDIDSQVMQLEDQKRQFDRTRQLHDRGLQTDQQFEAAELGIKNRESQIAASRKQLVQAEANLAAARLNVSYTKIYSPIDGVVIMRRVMPGQTVKASMNTPTLFMLCTPLQVLKLTAWVNEADIGRVRPGQTVSFQVGTYGSDTFSGTVDAIRLNAQTFNNIVTYPVWINVPNDDLRLRPSMTAQVSLYVSQTEEVVRIPNDALRFRPTRAAYLALGATPPASETERAVDHLADRVVDPTALRAREKDVEGEAETIDQLFAPLPKADSRATVWLWDDAGKQFVAKSIRVGVSDGTMSALLAGDLQPGDELVTGVILPVDPNVKPGVNPLLSNQRRGR